MVQLIITALRTFLPSMLALVVPAISFLIYYKFVDWFIAIALGAVGEINATTLTATGVGGWLLGQLRMAECISIYLACLTLGFCMSLVRR